MIINIIITMSTNKSKNDNEKDIIADDDEDQCHNNQKHNAKWSQGVCKFDHNFNQNSVKSNRMTIIVIKEMSLKVKIIVLKIRIANRAQKNEETVERN